MAEAVGSIQLGRWHDGEARVADVLDALQRLRREVPAMTSTRTAVMTLVAVATNEADSEWSLRAIRELGDRHPARTIMLLAAGDRQGVLDATVCLHGRDLDGRMAWWEETVLRASGDVSGHLDSLVEPFTLPDVPVVVWFVDALPPADDPLFDVADTVLVDSRDLADPATMHTIAGIAREHPVVDLSWVRLRLWRELLATSFDGEFRPFATGVDVVEVAGKPGPRRLLAGWIADRLALHRKSFHMLDADHAALRIVSHAGGRRGEFGVGREGDERLVVASGVIDGGPSFRSTRQLPPVSPAWGLADALAGLDGDPLFVQAIDAARTLGL